VTRIKKGDVIINGPAHAENGELALGQNMLIAYALCARLLVLKMQ